MWAKYFACCKKCGTYEIRHKAKGLCTNCYHISTEEKHKQHERKRGQAKDLLTKESLIEKYLNKKMSLGDIAKECFCSRQYVFKQIKFFNINYRTKKEARDLALINEKIAFDRIDKIDQDRESVTLRKIEVNENFFSKWSSPMAYVLGVICTDGNLLPGLKRNPESKTTSFSDRVTIFQKEPELLKKIAQMMNCNAKLYYAKQSRPNKDGNFGSIFRLQINSDKIYKDLLKLGLTPNKSLTLNFPPVPSEHLRHFLRGCWDGDGSLYVQDNSLLAHFVSGSINFIESIVNRLREEGFNKIKIHKYKNAYNIRLSPSESLKLCRFFYQDVKKGQFLERKYKIYKDYLNNRLPNNILKMWERGKSLNRIAFALKISPEKVSSVVQKRTDKGIILENQNNLSPSIPQRGD